ncbi:arginine--tRNA ligase [Pantoea sp. Mhis]|uniref:arginine--tRNA ligase n=1 Tax=Pantoea sp. Mhis TaxID=2576759 RepID=UPI001359D17D|nr:arginine--tRNA ligase [Pantoea sp. Mhis]MXP56175.1 arginine--tRNA ligase [Pantoea sp. Mhis]
MNIKSVLSNRINHAMILAGISANCDPQIHRSSKMKFGNYQVNGIISVAKKNGQIPSELAKLVVNYLDLDDIANKIEIANPGFINIFLKRTWLEQQINKLLQLPCLGIDRVSPQNIVIDYSSPNMAKEMHVGHIRSTIIGDAVACTLSFLGHNVIRVNHIGDWGTQFGMLIAYLDKKKNKYQENMILSNLENFYREAKNIYDKDLNFAKCAQEYVIKLQNGDEYCRDLWQKIVNISIAQNQKIYERLNVSLMPNHVMGESSYNEMLPEIVADLRKKGLAVISEGATVVFLDEFKNKQGNPMGVIIQKKDGGYLYSTTDIACAKYRYEKFHAERIIYYIDSRQHQHLQQVWSIVRKAGYVPESVSLEHHAFGMILGKDGTPFKTRSGNIIKLSDLLDESVERALKLISKKNPKMSQEKLKILSEIVGIGAIKYAELSKNRISNYIFNWDQMLRFDGNTAPYIQYAYTRILSVFRKANININHLIDDITLTEEYEVRLAIHLLQFEESLIQVAYDGTPHIMCSYLYELASLFSNFYEHCPIILNKNNQTCKSRLQLAALTAKTLKQGLNILGIQTVQYM